MFGNRRAVVEMPADGPVTLGGGDLAYGGFWARFAALIIDNAILTIVAVALIAVASLVDEALAALASVIYFIGALLYWPIMECSARQATFGKQVLGLQVTDAAGLRLSFLRSLGRNVAKIISAIPFYIGFLLAAFTSRKQALHDIIASCVVVRVGPASFMKAVGATVGAVLITAAGTYYYISNVYLAEMEKAEKAMKAAQKGRPAMKLPAEQTRAPGPAFPAGDKPGPAPAGAQPTPPPAAPAIQAPPTKVAAAPAPGTTAPVAAAPVKEPAAPVKPAPAPAPAKPATAEIKPPPAKPAAAPAAAKPATAELKPKSAKPAAAPAAPAPIKPASAQPMKAAAAPVVKAKPAPRPEPVITAAAPAEEAPKVAPRAEPAPRPAPPEIEWSRVPVASGAGPVYNDIMTAVMYRDRAAATQLLDLGWWPDRRDSNGVTPLMAAAMNGDAAMTELLLSRGANPTLRGPGGSTLDYAGRGGNINVAEMLRKAGAR